MAVIATRFLISNLPIRTWLNRLGNIFVTSSNVTEDQTAAIRGRVSSLMLDSLLFSTRLHSCDLLQQGGQYEKEGAIYDQDGRNNEKRHETRQEHGYAKGYGHRI
jgi:hypothetical protein